MALVELEVNQFAFVEPTGTLIKGRIEQASCQRRLGDAERATVSGRVLPVDLAPGPDETMLALRYEAEFLARELDRVQDRLHFWRARCEQAEARLQPLISVSSTPRERANTFEADWAAASQDGSHAFRAGHDITLLLRTAVAAEAGLNRNNDAFTLPADTATLTQAMQGEPVEVSIPRLDAPPSAREQEDQRFMARMVEAGAVEPTPLTADSASAPTPAAGSPVSFAIPPDIVIPTPVVQDDTGEVPGPRTASGRSWLITHRQLADPTRRLTSIYDSRVEAAMALVLDTELPESFCGVITFENRSHFPFYSSLNLLARDRWFYFSRETGALYRGGGDGYVCMVQTISPPANVAQSSNASVTTVGGIYIRGPRYSVMFDRIVPPPAEKPPTPTVALLQNTRSRRLLLD
jgi:hypothetical protein